MPQYTVGLDFGSQSARVVLVDTRDGREVFTAAKAYPGGIMTESLPDGTPLPKGWALQNPQDYRFVMEALLRSLCSQVDPKDILGVGIDCTSSTTLPVLQDGTPLCALEPFKHCPHAYVMMWKHHAAQAQASRMTAAARARGETWLPYLGGQVNAEWLFPKLLQLCEEAPGAYGEAAYVVEMGDWLVWQLTGRLSRSASTLGYKAFYYQNRFPEEGFFALLNPRFARAAEKLAGPALLPGQCAGSVTPEASRRTGLAVGTRVAAAMVDAHANFPAAGSVEPGLLVSILGTSGCYICLGKERLPIQGISGAVADGVIPGLIGYEAGQTAVGDQFAWFETNCVPGELSAQARRRGISAQQYLAEQAAALKPGQSGLLALDWWNGNRSVLADATLSGMMLGMTLQTTPAEIYRAMLESTAYGARMIVENYRKNGVAVRKLCVGGGIPRKNPLAMQILADVLHMPVYQVRSREGSGVGIAIMAAAAAGVYGSLAAAARAMGGLSEWICRPDEADGARYDRLYREYTILHDYFGRGGNDVMKRLRQDENP